MNPSPGPWRSLLAPFLLLSSAHGDLSRRARYTHAHASFKRPRRELASCDLRHCAPPRRGPAPLFFAKARMWHPRVP